MWIIKVVLLTDFRILVFVLGNKGKTYQLRNRIYFDHVIM